MLSRVLNGWIIGAIANVQTGAESLVSSGYETFNNYEAGGVMLQGITASQFRSMLLESPRSLPAGVAAVTTAAASLIAASGTANPTYFQPWQQAGTIGQNFYLAGPWYWTVNTSLKKDVRVNERLHVTLQGEFLNVLNHPEFGTPTLTPTSTTFGQVTSSMVSPRNIQLRGYLRW